MLGKNSEQLTRLTLGEASLWYHIALEIIYDEPDLI
jgi:hypothetical protein